MSVVSVLIPMKNAAPFVAQTLKSVLGQDGVDLDVVVIDDGSTDESVAIVEALNDPRVRVIPGPEQGVAAAMNRGLEAAQGELTAVCGADDMYVPGRLAWQAAWLEQHRDFAVVTGYYTIITEYGRHIATMGYTREAEEITDELRRGVTRSTPATFCMRTGLLRELGGYRTYFVTSSDIDLELRLGEVTRIWYEPKHTYIYRLHDKSITHTETKRSVAFFESTARKFHQQRMSGRADDLERGCPPQPPTDGSTTTLSVAAEIQKLLRRDAWRAFAAGRRVRALCLGARACLARPSFLPAWTTLARLLGVVMLKWSSGAADGKTQGHGTNTRR